MKKLLKYLMLLFITVVSLPLASCSDDEPGKGEVVNPTKPVADPAGTISLSMNNKSNGGTTLDRIGIGSDNNFYAEYTSYSELWFADLGEVAGIGNITAIPMTGWASKVQVKPGHGYVAYQRPYDYFYGQGIVYGEPHIYRIYVVDYITGVSGGIIGADIKYQTPFNGADVAISLDKTSLTVNKENVVNITNKSYVPFDFKVEGNFTCSRISDPNTSFITTGLNIQPRGIPNALGETGKLILTTKEGKVTELPLKIEPTDPYINDLADKITFDCYGKSREPEYVTFTTNIKSDVSVSCDADWVIADCTLEGEYCETGLLTIYAATNCSSETRQAKVKITMGSVTKSLTVEQTGFTYAPEFPDVIELSLDSPDWTYGGLRYYNIKPYHENLSTDGYNTGKYILFSHGYATLSWDAEWIQQVDYYNTYFTIVCNTNYKDGEVETDVDIVYPQNGVFENKDIVIKTIKIIWK